MRKLLWRALLAVAIPAAMLSFPSPAGASGVWWWPWPPAPPPAPTCGGVTVAKSTGGTWTCTFDDEFNGTSLNTTYWNILTNTTGAPINNGACYTANAANVSESGGYLNLTARKEASTFSCPMPLGASETTQYTSGSVATNNKFTQTYGRWDVRASFPAATVAGLQSTLWLYPASAVYGAWPLSGEIDFAEEYSLYGDRVVPYLHYAFDPSTVNTATNTNIVTNTKCLVTNVNDFHDYVVEWTTTAITISIDGTVCMVDHPAALGLSGMAPFNTPFFTLLTQALGIGNNAFDPVNTPLPATTRIDYVRVWK